MIGIKGWTYADPEVLQLVESKDGRVADYVALDMMSTLVIRTR